MSGSRIALVTNACGFAGPPAVSALLEAGLHVLAHDTRLADAAAWDAFAAGRAGLARVAATEPEAIVDFSGGWPFGEARPR